eukprot:CAMPEP_0198509166 /NCGR_PEP_ID=MMETSP1462-20131121/13401_1 /TAXON_ID=1333877 /ORGANISM="Brandtodinium nutriculum, Strain RCC3387" /LENGTH=436 /DNA_ID=CAMNT_0044238463 /DNA_START=74 /DNA_END=1381 /DNA_ORIENTATION=-
MIAQKLVPMFVVLNVAAGYELGRRDVVGAGGGAPGMEGGVALEPSEESPKGQSDGTEEDADDDGFGTIETDVRSIPDEIQDIEEEEEEEDTDEEKEPQLRKRPIGMGQHTYTFIRDLAQGSFGQVSLWQRAGAAEGKGYVALKEMTLLSTRPLGAPQPPRAEDKETLRREAYLFNREVAAHRALGGGHPNILAFYGSAMLTWSGDLKLSQRPLIMMEFAQGGTLRDLFGHLNNDALDVGERIARIAVLVLVNTLRGLVHMHKKGYIHGDIKPANIFVAEEGFECVDALSCRYMLGDFGMVTEADATGTCKGKGLGCTISYLPPEVRTLPPRLTTKGDVWALSVSLQEMLERKYVSGVWHKNFWAKNPGAKKMNFRDENNMRLREMKDAVGSNQNLPQAFRDLLLRDMANTDEDQRFTASQALVLAEGIAADFFHPQ